jgi:hypothetical protein
MLFVGGVLLVAAIIIIAILVSPGKKEPAKASVIPEVTAAKLPGVISDEDRSAVLSAERIRLEAARTSGSSAVESTLEPRPVVVHSKVANAKFEPPDTQNQQQSVQAQQQPAQVDQSKMVGLTKQMEAMMAAWGMSDPATAKTLYIRTPPKESASQQQASSQGGSQTVKSAAKGRVVAPAFEQVYTASIVQSYDSDFSTGTKARILTGPLAGMVIDASAARAGDGAQLLFNSGSLNGTKIKLSAIGIDEKTSSDIVEGRYNGRYAQRFVFPVLTEGIKAFAGARAQTGTQVVLVSAPAGGIPGVGAQQTPPPSTDQARNAMIAAGANQTGIALSTLPKQPQVMLDMNSTFGVMFLEPVFEGDFVQQGGVGESTAQLQQVSTAAIRK